MDHNHHPTDSIDNAAYPADSSYRPSATTTQSDDKIAMPEARYSQSYTTGPLRQQQHKQPAAPAALYPTYPAAAANAQSFTSASLADGPLRSPTRDPLLGGGGVHPSAPSPRDGPPSIMPWSPDGVSAANPNLPPPPPYDPSRSRAGPVHSAPPTPREPPSPYAAEHPLLGSQQQPPGQHNRLHGSYPGTPQEPPSPAAHTASSPPSGHGRGATEARGEGQPRAYMQSMTGEMPAYGKSTASLGPVAAARRRKRKLGILAGVLCVVLLFLIALVVGILMGAVKVNNKDSKPPPPARF